jgi:hypothetical protein
MPELPPEPEPMLELPPPERPPPSPLPEEPPPEKPLPVTWLEALNAALGCETVMNPAAISPPMRAAMAEMSPAVAVMIPGRVFQNRRPPGHRRDLLLIASEVISSVSHISLFHPPSRPAGPAVKTPSRQGGRSRAHAT